MDSTLLFEIGTLVVAIIGVWGGLAALKQGNRQKMLELGNLYLQRYWTIEEDLMRFQKGSDDHTQARKSYLRLCEDEFEAARLGWLDQRQWSVWHGWLASPESLLSEDLRVCDPHGGKFALVRQCISAGEPHAWTRCPARRESAETKSQVADGITGRNRATDRVLEDEPAEA